MGNGYTTWIFGSTNTAFESESDIYKENIPALIHFCILEDYFVVI